MKKAACTLASALTIIATCLYMSVGLASAAPTANAQKSFCSAYAHFGDAPGYANLTRVHSAVGKSGVKPASVTAYRHFESSLLAGRGPAVLRKDNAAVFRTCGVKASGSARPADKSLPAYFHWGDTSTHHHKAPAS